MSTSSEPNVNDITKSTLRVGAVAGIFTVVIGASVAVTAQAAVVYERVNKNCTNIEQLIELTSEVAASVKVLANHVEMTKKTAENDRNDLQEMQDKLKLQVDSLKEQIIRLEASS